MLSMEEREKIGQVNAENKWGIASEEYGILVAAHANAKDRNDETPVSYANQNGLNEIKDFLISHGALE